MKRLFIMLILITTVATSAQDKLYYNLAVNNCKEKSPEDMIDLCLKNSYLLNYDFKTFTGEEISTDKIKKPIILVAASSRVAPFIAYIPALNKMAEKYEGKVEFLVVFLDKEKGIKRVSKRIDSRIKLIPSTKDLENKAHLEAFGFVHRLDYPTTYFIDKNKQFRDIKRGAAYPSKTMKKEEADEANIKNLEDFIAKVI